MWMRCSLGQTWDGNSCTGTDATYTWQHALNAADIHSFAGYEDWRVPNIKELGSLVEQDCYSPAINQSIFSNAGSNGYWSSSPNAEYTTLVWTIHFNYGIDDYISMSISRAVRLVRNGQ